MKQICLTLDTDSLRALAFQEDVCYLACNFTGAQVSDGIFGALVVRQSPKRDPHFKQYDVDDPNHVIVINEWSRGFAIQRLLEPTPGTNMASLLINGRSQPDVSISSINLHDTVGVI